MFHWPVDAPSAPSESSTRMSLQLPVRLSTNKAPKSARSQSLCLVSTVGLYHLTGSKYLSTHVVQHALQRALQHAFEVFVSLGATCICLEYSCTICIKIFRPGAVKCALHFLDWTKLSDPQVSTQKDAWCSYLYQVGGTRSHLSSYLISRHAVISLRSGDCSCMHDP